MGRGCLVVDEFTILMDLVFAVLILSPKEAANHEGCIGGRFGDLQNGPIFKKNLTLTHRQKICIAPIMTIDSILDASKYSQQTHPKAKQR